MTNERINPLDDRLSARIMLDTMTYLHTAIAADIESIATGRFGDDDTDYFPARARTLANLISFTATADYEPAEALTAFLNDSEEYIEDLTTCDDHSPLSLLYFAYFDADYFDLTEYNAYLASIS